MNKESLIVGETIVKLYKEKKIKLIEYLIENLKKEKRWNILKEALDYLKEKNYQLKKIIAGKIYLAFDDDIDKIKKLIEERINCQVEIKDKLIDEKLILGGIFVGKGFMVDFSFKNILKKIFKKWKI
jgi:F0F1-type ATP synthase delta subunit